MNKIIIILAGTILFASLNVAAEVKPSKPTMGVGLGLVDASIEDPNGNTGSTRTVFPTFTYFAEMARDQRITGKFSYYDFALDASDSEIGQSVKTISFAGIYEWRQRLARKFKPWVGVGAAFNIDKSTSRHTVDSDGFLAQRFQNIDNSGISLLLHASYDFEFNNTDLSLKTTYTVPTYDGFKGLEISLNYLF